MVEDEELRQNGDPRRPATEERTAFQFPRAETIPASTSTQATTLEAISPQLANPMSRWTCEAGQPVQGSASPWPPQASQSRARRARRRARAGTAATGGAARRAGRSVPHALQDAGRRRGNRVQPVENPRTTITRASAGSQRSSSVAACAFSSRIESSSTMSLISVIAFAGTRPASAPAARRTARGTGRGRRSR